jgi:hypothetical protein
MNEKSQDNKKKKKKTRLQKQKEKKGIGNQEICEKTAKNYGETER